MTFGDAIVAEMPRLRGYARRLTRNDDSSADLVQDTVLLALDKEHLFDGRDLRAWLMTIMHHRFVTNTRRSLRRPTVPLGELDFPQHDNLDARIMARGVVDSIRRLPEGYGRALMGVAFDGLSYPEVAKREGVPIGTMRSRIARGRALLRREWDMRGSHGKLMTISILEAFNAGWQSSEKGEALPRADPYGNRILFDAYIHGWKSRELSERMQNLRRKGYFHHEVDKCVE
jgi:RNA polymerase sigma-70 factor, ECF subfamily